METILLQQIVKETISGALVGRLDTIYTVCKPINGVRKESSSLAIKFH